MALKSILVCVEESPLVPSLLATAQLAARRFDSHLTGVCPRSVMGAFVVAEGMTAASTAALEDIEAEEQERFERCRALFRDFAAKHGMRWGAPDGPIETPSADWPGEASLTDEAIGQMGRVHDLIVAGRPMKGEVSPRISTLEAVLFDSGRPLLIAPPSAPERLGETVLIAWNGSTETARAVNFALPVLARAGQVFVLAVEGGSVPGPNAGEVAVQLRRDGIAAEARGVRPEGRTTGEAILDQAADLGADLLIKGAYTHSRLRQMVFGGATSHILAAAELPVFMAH